MHPVRDGDDGRGRDDDELRLRPALGAARSDRRHRLVTDGDMLDALADRLDDAGGVHPGHPRRGQSLDAVLPQPDVRRVHRGGFHREPNLARPRLSHVALDHAEDLGPSRPRDHDGACRRHSRSSRSETVSSVTWGRRFSGTRLRSSAAADPAPDEHGHGAAEMAERDVEGYVVADHGRLLRGNAQPRP